MSLSTRCHLLQPKKKQHKTTTSWEVHHPFLVFMFFFVFFQLQKTTRSQEACCHLLGFFLGCRRQQQARRLIIVLCNSIKITIKQWAIIFCTARKKIKWQRNTIIVVFCHDFIRKPQDDNECCARRYLLPLFHKPIRRWGWIFFPRVQD